MSEHTTESTSHAAEAHTHDVGYGTYIMVWLGLVALTAITVTIAGIHLGSVTLIAALMIASIKTVLVVSYFMHVRFDNMTIKIFIYVCLLVFIIIMILTFSDLSFR
jgi:cytochrome c oxidase subunit 4